MIKNLNKIEEKNAHIASYKEYISLSQTWMTLTNSLTDGHVTRSNNELMKTGKSRRPVESKNLSALEKKKKKG